MSTDSESGSALPHGRSLVYQPVLPTPEIYEEEYRYWPWGHLIDLVTDWVSTRARDSTFILDYMCGTGFLLHNIRSRRPDLTLLGCSLTPTYIDYANLKYPQLNIELQDVLLYRPITPPNIIICTAGLHHLVRQVHSTFIEKVADELAIGNYFLIAEELIRPYKDELDRRHASLELWTELIAYVINKGGTEEVIEAAGNVLVNDIFERGEFKLTYDQMTELLEPYFYIEEVVQTWPDKTKQWGDFLFICRRK